MADEGIELRSPFPVVPPLKDSKWNDLPSSADGESRPVDPPSLLPDIGESHPCPYFVGRDLNFIKSREERERKKKEVPIIVPPPTIPIAPKVAEPLIEKLPVRSVIPENTKQQHINGTENRLQTALQQLKGCTIASVRIYDQKSFGRLDSDAAWNSLRSGRFLACHAGTRLFEAQTPTQEEALPEIFKSFWLPVLYEVNDAQNYLQTEGLSIHRCAKKIRALQSVLEAKREKFVNDALIYPKNLCEELEISLEPPRRIRRKRIFGDGNKDVQLSYEDDLRRTKFFSIDRETGEILERLQQLQNLGQKYAFLRPEVILSMDELERVRLQAFVGAADPGCKKELIRSVSLDLLKYIIESKLEDGLPNIVIMLRIF
ncbi:hypothetical protein TNCV_2034591 [Trichonephila clavipes]|nr:hypothetical protein TNCV_2034591 [Trichonephila clavipes]